MIQAPSFLSSGAIAAVGAHSDYFASAVHYESLAHRIAAALRGDGRFVLVTGDPPADPQVLSQALGNVLGPRYAVIDISCGPALRGEDLERAVPMLPGPRASGGAAVEPECTVSASPLFVFEDFDQLSDRQIEEVCEGTLHADQIRAAGVLLAPLDFLVRLERPALHFLKDRIAAQFRFQEVGDDEAIGVLHDQLFSQRDRGAETRGFRRGILVGLAVGTSLMAVMAATIGIYIVHPTAEQVDGAAASIEQGGLASEESSVLRPADATVSDLSQLAQPAGTAKPLDHPATGDEPSTAPAQTTSSEPIPPAVIRGIVTDAPNAATWVLADQTIRLWGIKPQPSNSVASLVNWVRAKGFIECVPRAKTGRYQCFTATGEDIAEAALLAGVARAGDRAPAAYRNAETQARRQEKGLWGRR